MNNTVTINQLAKLVKFKTLKPGTCFSVNNSAAYMKLDSMSNLTNAVDLENGMMHSFTEDAKVTKQPRVIIERF